MNYVKIVATLYDKDGKVLGTDFTYTDIDVLRPAEKSPFEIILTDLGQSQKVGSYKLYASGQKTEPLPASLKFKLLTRHIHHQCIYLAMIMILELQDEFRRNYHVFI